MSLDLGVPAISGLEKGLQLYEAARRALAEARRIDEVREIRNRAEALRAYGQQARDNELVFMAAEIKLRAERRAGELIVEMKAAHVLRTRGEPEYQSDGTRKTTLREIGITRIQAHKWQIAASVPEEQFENWLVEQKPDQIPTTHGVVKLADKLRTKAVARCPQVNTHLSISEAQFRDLQKAWLRAWPSTRQRFQRWIEDEVEQPVRAES